MLDLEDLLGKVVTVKTANGNEFIGKLIGTNEEGTVATFEHLRSVLINAGDVIIAPLCLTAEPDTVDVPTSSLFCVVETLELSAEDYTGMVKDELAARAKAKKSDS
jgi:hypothetical protein